MRNHEIHRISATLTESQYQYLSFLAETEGLATTTFACRILEDKIRTAIYENKVPITLPRTNNNLKVLKTFLNKLITSKNISNYENEELANIAEIINCDIKDLYSIFD